MVRDRCGLVTRINSSEKFDVSSSTIFLIRALSSCRTGCLGVSWAFGHFGAPTRPTPKTLLPQVVLAGAGEKGRLSSVLLPSNTEKRHIEISSIVLIREHLVICPASFSLRARCRTSLRLLLLYCLIYVIESVAKVRLSSFHYGFNFSYHHDNFSHSNNSFHIFGDVSPPNSFRSPLFPAGVSRAVDDAHSISQISMTNTTFSIEFDCSIPSGDCALIAEDPFQPQWTVSFRGWFAYTYPNYYNENNYNTFDYPWNETHSIAVQLTWEYRSGPNVTWTSSCTALMGLVTCSVPTSYISSATWVYVAVNVTASDPSVGTYTSSRRLGHIVPVVDNITMSLNTSSSMEKCFDVAFRSKYGCSQLFFRRCF